MQLNQEKNKSSDLKVDNNESVGHDMHVKSEQTKHSLKQNAEYSEVTTKTQSLDSSDEEDD